MGRRHAGVQPHRRPAAGARRPAGRRGGRDRDRPLRPRERDAGRCPAYGAQRRTARSAGRGDPRQDRQAQGRRDRRRPSIARVGDGRSGPTSSRSLRPRPRGAARVDTRRQRGRLLPGWRRRLVRAQLGLSANSVAAIELVTADGQPRRVDADNEPTSSGRCAAAAATSASSRRSSSSSTRSPEVYAGVLFFPWERSPRSCTRGGGGHRAGRGHLARPDPAFPPLAEIPEPFRGGKFALVEAVYMGDEARRGSAAPLRDARARRWTPSR